MHDRFVDCRWKGDDGIHRSHRSPGEIRQRSDRNRHRLPLHPQLRHRRRLLRQPTERRILAVLGHHLNTGGGGGHQSPPPQRESHGQPLRLEPGHQNPLMVQPPQPKPLDFQRILVAKIPPPNLPPRRNRRRLREVPQTQQHQRQLRLLHRRAHHSAQEPEPDHGGHDRALLHDRAALRRAIREVRGRDRLRELPVLHGQVEEPEEVFGGIREPDTAVR